MFDRIRLQYQAFRYASRLPAMLLRYYGARACYNEIQIQRAARVCRLNPEYIWLAFARYLTDSDYKRLAPVLPHNFDRRRACELFVSFTPNPTPQFVNNEWTSSV